MYRDRYPYIKMVLPSIEANPMEEKAWKEAIIKVNNSQRINNNNNICLRISNISDSNSSLKENSESESDNIPVNLDQNEELHSKLVEIVTELIEKLLPLRNNGVIQLTQISIEFLALDDIETKIAFLIGNLDDLTLSITVQ